MEVSVADNKKSFLANSAVGIISGTAFYVFSLGSLNNKYNKYLSDQIKKTPQSENLIYWNSAKTALKTNPLLASKIKMVDINKNNWEPIADTIIKKSHDYYNEHKKNIFVRFSKIFDTGDKKLRNIILTSAEGNNACFVPITSQILVNSKEIGITTFHELGHAINNQGNGFKKILQKSRITSILVLPILCIGLLTPKCEEEDKYKNPMGKTATFIKNHCGLLSFLTLLPIVMEEGLASVNGTKLAKNLLNKDMYNKLKKINVKAFGSYAINTVLTGICASIGVYIKDKISGTKPVKKST